jgi:hypothetical protein
MFALRSALRVAIASAALATTLTAVPSAASAAPSGACGSGHAGAPTVIFNPCASLDLTGVEDCRSGTCYAYCWTRWVTVWCEPKFKFINVRDWLTYKSGTTPPRGCHTE